MKENLLLGKLGKYRGIEDMSCGVCHKHTFQTVSSHVGSLLTILLKITVWAECIIDKLFVFHFFLTSACAEVIVIVVIDCNNTNSNESYDFLTSTLKIP